MNNIIDFKGYKDKRQATAKCVCGNSMNADELACPVCSVDLNYTISQRLTNKGTVMTMTGEIPLAKYIEHLMERGIGDFGTCAICGERYVLYGHNPYPVVTDYDARCCARCNDEVVFPARMQMQDTGKPLPKRKRSTALTTHEYLQGAATAIILHLSTTYALHSGGKAYRSLLGNKLHLYDAAVQSLESMTVAEFVDSLSHESLGTAPKDILELPVKYGSDKLMGEEALPILQNSDGFWKEFFEALVNMSETIVQAASRLNEAAYY